MHDQAQRINVGRRADRLVPALLRARVLLGADKLPGLGEVPAVVLHHAGDPEIDHLRPPLAVEEDVARFQVAVDDAGSVAMSDGLADGEQDFQSLSRIEAPLPAALDQGSGPGNVFHDEVGDVFTPDPLASGGEHLGDSRMPKAAEEFGLPLKPLPGRERAAAGPHRLHRHVPRGRLLPTEIDTAHASLVDQLLDEDITHLAAQQRVMIPGRQAGR